MRAIVDALDTAEPMQERKELRILSAVFPVVKSALPTQRRPRIGKWSSTLAPQDLRCLLSVLETQLIPGLIRDYAPGWAAPLPLYEPGE